MIAGVLGPTTGVGGASAEVVWLAGVSRRVPPKGMSRRGDLGEDLVTGGIKEKSIDPSKVKSGSFLQSSSSISSLELSNLVCTDSELSSELG